MIEQCVIDVNQFRQIAPIDFRLRVAELACSSVSEPDNLGYFTNLGTYVHRESALPLSIERLGDLFAPNLAVLDFLGKDGIDSGSEVVLDYACGLGGLLVYLVRLGFQHVYGYDNWAQIARGSSIKFLSAFDLQNRLLELEMLDQIAFTVLVCVGLSWSSYKVVLPDAVRVLDQPSLRYVLADSAYMPIVPGFELIAQYPGLLNVYERMDWGRSA